MPSLAKGSARRFVPLSIARTTHAAVPATAARAMSSAAMSASVCAGSDYHPRYIDIGINLADPIFRGRYHGKQRHPDDLAGVVQRARDVGCTKLIVTGSSFQSSRDALKLAEQFPGTVYTTAGIHPCSSAIFERRHTRHHEHDAASGAEDEGAEDEGAAHTPACDPDPTQPHAEDGEIDHARSQRILADLQTLVERAPRVALVALGEMGLDYDRLHYCAASTQRHAFAAQLALVARLAAAGRPLPLFLHARACHRDFVRLLQDQFGPRLATLPRGAVVHSFTGTVAEAEELMDLGLYLGVNGCSLKTAANCDVVRAIRLDRLMIETDGPWCEVRPSHAGWSYLVAAAAAARARADEAAEAARQAAEKAAAEKAAAEEAAREAAAKEASDGASAPPSSGDGRPPRRRKQNNPAANGANNGGKKKVPAVPDRFKVVKKEKWEEGAMVKGRNEACTIERIAVIIAGIKGLSVEAVCEAAWANTVKVFGTE